MTNSQFHLGRHSLDSLKIKDVAEGFVQTKGEEAAVKDSVPALMIGAGGELRFGLAVLKTKFQLQADGIPLTAGKAEIVWISRSNIR